MLKQRVLTALILAPLVIWGILSLSTPVFALLFGLITVTGAWEWAGLSGSPARVWRLAYSVVVAAVLLALWQVVLTAPNSLFFVFVVAFVWWCGAFLCVAVYPRFSLIWDRRIIKTVTGLLVLVPAWLALTSLHASPVFGPTFVLFLAFLIWFADSGAYFGGRLWGRKKLAQRVSPGKTWEGVYSAMFVVCIYALATGYFMDVGNGSHAQWLVFVGLSLVTVAFSILGDLTESMFKRQANIKDSGSILPGHGGMLDRIDSITSAAPVFVLGLWFWKGLALQPVTGMSGMLP